MRSATNSEGKVPRVSRGLFSRRPPSLERSKRRGLVRVDVSIAVVSISSYCTVDMHPGEYVQIFSEYVSLL